MNKLIKYMIINLLVIGIISFISINVSAEVSFGYDVDFFNSANTYNLGVEEKEDYYKFTFDKNNKNNKTVETKPSITFLTHGLSGTAADLSRLVGNSSNKFGYNKRSVLNMLKEKSDANLYLCRFTNEYSFKLYKIEGTTTYNLNEIDHITDISKHSVVCYWGYNASEGNDYIYSQFNIMASYVINDVSNLKGGILPKVNLIGHSRGGLTNLQYALDHPDLVYSMYAISSPLFGTTIATIDYNCSEDGKPVMENGGIRDIADRNVYMSYYNRWNNNYDELYKNIKCHALGMYQDLTLLFYQLSFSTFYNMIDKYNSVIYIAYAYLAVVARGFNDLIGTIEVFNGLSKFMSTNIGQEALDKLKSEMYIEKDIVFEFDGLVDLYSQLGKDEAHGYEYKGFNRFCYKLNINADYDYRYTARGGTIVTHAAAPYVVSAVNYIKNTIEL